MSEKPNIKELIYKVEVAKTANFKERNIWNIIKKKIQKKKHWYFYGIKKV